MARAATLPDAFDAVADPRRRQILDALQHGERTVNELVDLLGLEQPYVSKHLRILREVGVVSVRDDGRHRRYRVHAPALKPIHDWASQFERAWTQRFGHLDTLLEELQHLEADHDRDQTDPSDDRPPDSGADPDHP
ncbi:ArsR/SmtB family transcription factor [Deinococcus aquatilis]|uniref:ArsR/SmtB family transcription factor n=1 Tax=Deinococcus aquatilis TaxID=519440 RepID=UPI0003768ED6|nr:metalloregulator ArsR/SmtB family transcription factor [Deinococcus aquatilis]